MTDVAATRIWIFGTSAGLLLIALGLFALVACRDRRRIVVVLGLLGQGFAVTIGAAAVYAEVPSALGLAAFAALWFPGLAWFIAPGASFRSGSRSGTDPVAESTLHTRESSEPPGETP